MRKKLMPILLLLVFLAPASVRAQATARVLWLKAEGTVSTVMTEYVERGVKQAGGGGYSLIILQLNTPGGQIDLMERIVTALRESTVPVVVYVAPRGAMAGSAGTLITLAGHLAAMAPETAIGAASPVGSQGEDLNQTLAAKEKEILSALVRSLTENRPAEAVALAESTIQSAKAVSSSEALAVGLIDIVADSREDLLRQLDGRTVRLAGGEVTLHTGFAAVDELDLSIIEILLGVLTNPNIVFILLAIGVQAILIELSQPGGWVAGFIGAVCLALAFYGMGLLTVNWLGLAFVVLAFVLFFMEFQTPTHGALTVAGLWFTLSVRVVPPRENWSVGDTLGLDNDGDNLYDGADPDCGRVRGDMNCSSTVNFDDINGFVLALIGKGGYDQAYPTCLWLNADCNSDGLVNFDDINAFVSLLVGG